MARSARAVFLDRDGVLTRPVVRDGRPFAPRSLEELEPLPGAPEACAALHKAGFRLIVVTNQPDVARGTLARSEVERMHEKLRAWFPLDDIRVCCHDDSDRCSCRKPEPGMLLEAAAAMGIDLARSYAVGDRWRDVEAGRRAGCRTILVDWGYIEPLPREPDARVSSLAEAARHILDGSASRDRGDHA